MVKRIKLSLVVSAVALALFTGCGYDNEDENVVGANLILNANTFTPVIDLTKEQLQAGFDFVATESNTTAQTARLGIKSYKINYMTTDDNGKSVRTSGLITVPTLTKEFLDAYKADIIPGLNNSEKRDFSLSIVSDQHGTIFEDAKSPTLEDPNKLSYIFSGAALFMTVQPDYIGFGDSNESHPFILEKSLANCTVDMIKASIAFANKAGLPINGQVFLSGYSEGGFATMAAAKEIQANHPDINLKAVAPMAGPYDMETLGSISVAAPVMPFPPYLAYVVHAYSEVYDDIDSKDIITNAYQPMLSTLFDTEHNRSAIYMALPNVYIGDKSQSPDKLLQASLMSDYQNDKNTPLRKRFAENSPIDWKPTMPMKILHCKNDMVIPYKMSELAYASFMEQGANPDIVKLVPIDGVTAAGGSVHGNCGLAAYAQVIPWFASIRRGEK